MRERKPGLERKNCLHPVGIAGQNDDKILALVFHHLQQDLDRFLPIVALVFWR